ncbi:diguanylate cyclase (GGDEF)-like protein [Geodermatophilus bullaregiensis]|uniref:GGDEF domain-containing protein n=1 Tax=Geodermatophilus bullaregiensis TaxID=1564160 RepID=UPI0027DAFB8A|nr:GGDEF domain-containing protein [Geodermatophilus bullaregiensis]MBM7806667.1 diguanylate cyclase (GGDEF)-like protein [Geodermatophilus bullaregiensis]
MAADDPEVVAELTRRARSSGIVLAVTAMLVLPAWAPLDLYLEPDLAGTFITLRLLGVLPMALALWLLVRRPLGRRRPELVTTVLVLGVVQAAVLWMLPQVEHPTAYALGLAPALFGIGGVLAGRAQWTLGLSVFTWAGLVAAALVAGDDLPGDELVTVAAHLATATAIAVVTHGVRQKLSLREVRGTVSLHREQERTRRLLARLERLSEEDPLTGLANRRRWDAELDAACAAARRSGQPVAVVLVDLDRFKQVNDRHGHAGGDAALRAVADLLRAAVRSGDVVARLGGDELAVLLPGGPEERAVELAERVRLATLALELPGFDPGELTVSLGVAAAAGEDAAPAVLTVRADSCLYAAKGTRNAVGTAARLPAPA